MGSIVLKVNAPKGLKFKRKKVYTVEIAVDKLEGEIFKIKAPEGWNFKGRVVESIEVAINDGKPEMVSIEVGQQYGGQNAYGHMAYMFFGENIVLKKGKDF